MNISQNPLNPYLPIRFQSKTKHGGYGMLDLELQDKGWSSLFALPLIFTGYGKSSIRHAIKTKGEVEQA